jgi:protein SCO1
MKMKNTLILLFVLVLGIFFTWFFLKEKEDKPLRYLPYFGPKSAMQQNDTMYHRVGDFSFINQYGKQITQEQIAGKIYVCDYFFTTCKSICPIMNTQMVRVYKAFKDHPDFLILSHTVDPETDTVAQLAWHASKYGVNDDRWHFLTGEKKSIIWYGA